MTIENTGITGPILVVGATGTQGGAVAAALLKAGKTVRALVRNPDADKAKALAAAGAELVKGDMTDRNSLVNAIAGVEGVFSVQLGPRYEDDPTEIKSGKALIDTAFEAGVRMFVHTSVARAGDQENFVEWGNDRWYPHYWNSKSAVNDAVASRGFEFYTILKPALIMINYTPPMVELMYPELVTEGKIVSATLPTTKLDHIAPEDIGAFALAAFEDPQKFNRAVIDLAAVSPTLEEIAAALTRVTGHSVVTEYIPEQVRIEQGYFRRAAELEQWMNVEGYKVDIAALGKWGIPLMSFDEWISKHKDEIVIGKSS